MIITTTKGAVFIMKKRFIGLFLTLIFLIGILTVLPIHGESEIYTNVLRLHVLANSDSEEDQTLKLKVRDAVLEKSSALLKNITTREAAEKVLKQDPHLDQPAHGGLKSLMERFSAREKIDFSRIS